MQKVKSFLSSLLTQIQQRPIVAKLVHTFWQAALGVFVAGIFAAHSPQDVKALVVAAVAAGASAIKTQLVATYRSRS